jgi:hypothetical protein
METSDTLMSSPHYRWRIDDVTSPWRKKGRWRKLTWEMSEAKAAEWARATGIEKIEKVLGSEKHYVDVGGRQGGYT